MPGTDLPPDIDTSRISITAHITGYTWYANGLSPAEFTTTPGRLFYHGTGPFMKVGCKVLGICDFETTLLQRHRIIDVLLEKAMEERGVGQVLELACGLSARAVRFAEKHGPNRLRWVEADLPGMAARKEKALRNAGLLGENHRVVPVNILAEKGELCLESLAEKYLDPDIPTAVLTEGITYYFPLVPMEAMWRRIAAMLNSRAGGVYLHDDLACRSGAFHSTLLSAWTWLVGVVARGRMHLHDLSLEEFEKALVDAGFSRVHLFRPEDFVDTIPENQVPGASFVDIVEAVAPGKNVA